MQQWKQRRIPLLHYSELHAGPDCPVGGHTPPQSPHTLYTTAAVTQPARRESCSKSISGSVQTSPSSQQSVNYCSSHRDHLTLSNTENPEQAPETKAVTLWKDPSSHWQTSHCTSQLQSATLLLLWAHTPQSYLHLQLHEPIPVPGSDKVISLPNKTHQQSSLFKEVH